MTGGGPNEVLGCFLCFCLDVCGWLTLAKLIRNRRKTRFSKGKAGTRQNNLRHIVFVNVIYNSRGVYLQQNKSWQAHTCRSALLVSTRLSASCRRPYHVECTGSLLTSEVKRHRARLVLGWGIAWEDLRVLSALSLC